MGVAAKWTRLDEGVHVRVGGAPGEGPGASLLAVVGTDGVLVHGPATPADLEGLVDGERALGVDDVVLATRPGLGAPLLVHEDDPLAAGAARTVVSVHALDLGGRYVEVLHPGRGATGSDLVVVVPAADVVAAGDLVRVPGPPGYGPDSWPLEWPATLDLVLGTTTARTRVVPGSGPVVDREAVDEQRQQVLDLAEQVDVLASRGVAPEDAWDRGTWPWPRSDDLDAAVRRAFAQWSPRPQARHAH